MTVVGSAPGKLILTGEYAVLDGAPALVIAVDRRATAQISAPERAGEFTVHAPDLGLHATGSLRGSEIRWEADARTVSGLSLVTQVLQHAAARGPIDPCTITLSTAAFFDASGTKLGLGSSAALTVALAGALAAHARRAEPTLAELIALHRAFQGGRGSGADIAASHAGGAILFTTGAPVSATALLRGSRRIAANSGPIGGYTTRSEGNSSDTPTPSGTASADPTADAPLATPSLEPDAPLPPESRRIAANPGPIGGYTTRSEGVAAGSVSAHPATLPAGLAWAVVFTGRSASTQTMLQQLEAWRAQYPSEYQNAATRLHAAAEHAATLCRNEQQTRDVINRFLAAVDDYATALDALGAAANLDIMSSDHRHLRNLAADRGVIYKPSGAGGGDIGVAFAGDADHIARFRDSAIAAGYSMIDVGVDDRGLTVTGG